jgi:Recombination endonuclease VII
MASAAEEHRRLLDAQNGVCAVCKLPSRRTLCVDHCHATRQVRGLLCDKCNTALGLLGDDSDRMRAAGAYVDRARGSQRQRK